jgi:hypothetical protein
MTFSKVEEYVQTAQGISFDGCHKIYVLMDDQQVKQCIEWGYGEDESSLITDLNPEEMLTVLKNWYESSCDLRFIEAVTTNLENPNAGFKTLIPQGLTKNK